MIDWMTNLLFRCKFIPPRYAICIEALNIKLIFTMPICKMVMVQKSFRVMSLANLSQLMSHAFCTPTALRNVIL